MDDLLDLGAGIPPLAIVLAFMIPLAITVYWYGNRRFGQQLGGSLGRGRWGLDDEPLDAAFREQVRRFQDRDRPGPIADAPAGMVMIRGVLSGSDLNLGGAPGRECVWRNRADGRRDMAIGADVVFIRDASGQAALEGIERAQVVAPEETARASRGHEWMGLYLGDEVEVIGRFTPESDVAEDGDPSAQVYGSLGQDGKLHVRLVRRPPPPEPTVADATASATEENEETQETQETSDTPSETSADA
jgi:hypothetical protein